MLIAQSCRSNSSNEVPSSQVTLSCAKLAKLTSPVLGTVPSYAPNKLLMLFCLECWFICNFLKFLKLFIVHVSMCTCMRVEVRKQLEGICSLLPACGSLEPNSSLQAWQQISSLYELPYQPHWVDFLRLIFFTYVSACSECIYVYNMLAVPKETSESTKYPTTGVTIVSCLWVLNPSPLQEQPMP